MKTGIFMADGCEEIEGLTVVDILRRAGLEIEMISISSSKSVTGSHGITFLTDTVFEDVNFDALDAVVLPGGMPGFAASGKLTAAICAAPSVLGAAGILDGKHAVCHPGFEEKLTGAIVSEDTVMTDGTVITSRGMGTAIDFALAIVSYLKDDAAVSDLKQKLVYT